MTYDSKEIPHYLQILNHPADEARGFTRWWWYGTSVSEEEIDRELTLIREAELGGVEIQFTYPMQEDAPEARIEHIPYFSPRFFEVLDHMVRKAEGLGLWVDLTLGSGWQRWMRYFSME